MCVWGRMSVYGICLDEKRTSQLHGGEVERVEGHAAGRDLSLGEAFVLANVELVGGHEPDEGGPVALFQGGNVGVLVDVGGVAEEGREGSRKDAGDDGSHRLFGVGLKDLGEESFTVARGLNVPAPADAVRHAGLAREVGEVAA